MRDHDGLTFPLEEYQRRLRELRQRMQLRKVDVLLVTDPENLTYLTGYQTTGYSYFQCLVVPLEQEPFMVTRLLEDSNVYARTWVEKSYPYNDTGDAIQAVWHALVEAGLNRAAIGYEKNSYYFPAYQQERMAASLRFTELYDCSGIVEQGRIVKSPDEIEVMRKAAAATEAGMHAGIAAVRDGVSENEIAAEIHHAMFKAGGEYPAVSPYVTVGPRTCIGHATWEGATINPGEVAFLELGGCFRRYHTAMMRTVHVGAPAAEVREAEAVVVEALEAMLENIRPGLTASDVDNIARSVFASYTGSGELVTRSGYAIGIAFAPSWDEGYILSLKPGENTILQENMTFHLIPWLFRLQGNKVMAISETIRVTEDGCESFFNTERKLFVVE